MFAEFFGGEVKPAVHTDRNPRHPEATRDDLTRLPVTPTGGYQRHKAILVPLPSNSAAQLVYFVFHWLGVRVSALRQTILK
jgi:hypothetical protein